MLITEQEIIQVLLGIKEENRAKGRGFRLFFSPQVEAQAHKKLEGLINSLKKLDISTLSHEFISHELVTEYLTHDSEMFFIYGAEDGLDKLAKECLRFFIIIRNAIESPAPSDQLIKVLEQLLEKEAETYKKEKAFGMALHNTHIVNASVLKTVYASNNEQLITLFKKHLGNMSPRAESFGEQPIPVRIRTQSDALIATLADLAKHNRSFNDIERASVVLQRTWRSYWRDNTYKKLLREVFKVTDFDPTLLQKPYQPQCDEALALRIMKISKQLKLFDTIRHLTSQNALTSILDDGFFGQQNLINHLMSYSPAALNYFDRERGDANAICFGPNKIDSFWVTDNTVEIVLHSEPVLTERNLPIFFKQRDFGFNTEQQRENFPNCPLLSESDGYFSQFSFMHTERAFTYKNDIEFKLFDNNKTTIAHSIFPFHAFIFKNQDNLHQILSLNFFKFIDALRPVNPADTSKIETWIKQFYEKINTFTDQELYNFIQRVGTTLIKTAEFNIYGAYKIDNFSIIKSITSRYALTMTPQEGMEPYTLNIQAFLLQLNKGDTAALDDAKRNLPELFQSYRFLDYLISNTTNENSQAALNILKEQCKTPRWIQTITSPGFFKIKPATEPRSCDQATTCIKPKAP